MNKAIYPGSFDPITNGHLDVIERSSKLFDYLIIAVTKNNNKSNFLFSELERVELIKKSTEHLKNVEIKIGINLYSNNSILKKLLSKSMQFIAVFTV